MIGKTQIKNNKNAYLQMSVHSNSPLWLRILETVKHMRTMKAVEFKYLKKSVWKIMRDRIISAQIRRKEPLRNIIERKGLRGLDM